MSSEDGDYCSICGGIPPDKIKTKQILIDGKATGVENLDFILENVRDLNLKNDREIVTAIIIVIVKARSLPDISPKSISKSKLSNFILLLNGILFIAHFSHIFLYIQNYLFVSGNLLIFAGNIQQEISTGRLTGKIFRRNNMQRFVYAGFPVHNPAIHTGY
jgi:hypothetical protein